MKHQSRLKVIQKLSIINIVLIILFHSWQFNLVGTTNDVFKRFNIKLLWQRDLQNNKGITMQEG